MPMSYFSGVNQHAKYLNTPCHVPRFKEPFVIGTDIVEPTRVPFVCETLRLLGPGRYREIELPKLTNHCRQISQSSECVGADTTQGRRTLDLRQCLHFKVSGTMVSRTISMSKVICNRMKPTHLVGTRNHLCGHLWEVISAGDERIA